MADIKFKPHELALIRTGWDALQAYCDLYIGANFELQECVKEERRALKDWRGKEATWFTRARVMESYAVGFKATNSPMSDLRGMRLGLIRATLLGLNHAFNTQRTYMDMLADVDNAVVAKEQAFKRAMGSI